MKRPFFPILVYILFACTASSWGSGYVISAHSVNSYGLTSAYVANSEAADSAYFNPANMVWLGEEAMIDAGATYIQVAETKFDGTVGGIPASANSNEESSILPFIHFVSPEIGKWRFGASIIEPAGIAKRWDAVVQKATAEETMLRVIVINPSAAYMLNSRFSIGAGLRIVYSDAEMKAQLPPGLDPALIRGYRQDLEGDTWEAGFNLAATFKPIESLHLAATFHSEIDMGIEGSASGYTTDPTTGEVYSFSNAPGSTSIPLPAKLALAISKTFGKTTLEFVYERLFWSAFDVMDVNFNDQIIEQTLGGSQLRDWNDTNDFRLGVSYQQSKTLKLMTGVSYEETPVPDRTLGFELPDSDLLWFAAGATYAFKPNMELGCAYTYGHYSDRTIDSADANVNGIVGEFSDTSFHSLSASFSYRF